jgi:hypothetical protein
MWQGTTLSVTAADMPNGEFYDFYSISPEYFGYHLICDDMSEMDVTPVLK